MRHFLVDLFKTMVRSVVVWAFVFAMIWAVIKEIAVPEWFIASASTVLVFWFRNGNNEHK